MSTPHCSGPCRQGRDRCPTPLACGLAEPSESAVRASRQFRPDYGIDGPHAPRRLSILARRRVRSAIVTACCLAVILIVLVLAFHQINLANLFR